MNYINKDNPVPSLDKELIKDIEHVCAWYQGRRTEALDRVESWLKSLQNGVETEKN